MSLELADVKLKINNVGKRTECTIRRRIRAAVPWQSTAPLVGVVLWAPLGGPRITPHHVRWIEQMLGFIQGRRPAASGVEKDPREIAYLVSHAVFHMTGKIAAAQPQGDPGARRHGLLELHGGSQGRDILQIADQHRRSGAVKTYLDQFR